MLKLYIVRRYVSLQLQDARRSFADPFLNFTCGPSADPTLADSEFKSSAHHTGNTKYQGPAVYRATAGYIIVCRSSHLRK